MVKCPKCGNTTASPQLDNPNIYVCTKCKYQGPKTEFLEPSKPSTPGKTKACPNCNSPIDINATSCDKCGWSAKEKRPFTNKYWYLLNIIFGVISVLVSFVFIFPKFPELIGLAVLVTVVSIWIYTLIKKSVGASVYLMIFVIAVSFLLQLPGVSSYIRTVETPLEMVDFQIRSGWCSFSSQVFPTLSIEKAFETRGVSLQTLEYRRCMGITGEGEEQKSNWVCGDNCLILDTFEKEEELTAREGRQFAFDLKLKADNRVLKTGINSFRNIKITISDEQGNEIPTSGDMCTEKNPCILDKNTPSYCGTNEPCELLTVNIEKVSCSNSWFIVKATGSYEFSVSSPKFDIIAYPTVQSSKVSIEEDRSERYGPLKLVFAGRREYYLDRPLNPLVNLKLYYVGGGFPESHPIAKGDKIKIVQFPTGEPLKLLGCGDLTTTGGYEEFIIQDSYEINDEYLMKSYPYVTCEFELPKVTSASRYGFQASTDYTFNFEVSFRLGCIGTPAQATPTPSPSPTVTPGPTATPTEKCTGITKEILMLSGGCQKIDCNKYPNVCKECC